MDSKCQQEDSTNSSGEEADQVHLQIGATSRSYECVFCKRGFTTAQALGGHMNIHRKDKAKTRPSKENKQQQNGYGCQVPTINFPVSTCTHNHSHQNLLRGIEDYQVGLSLSLKFGTSKFGEDELEMNGRGGLIEDDDDLDLELRLGHNP